MREIVQAKLRRVTGTGLQHIHLRDLRAVAVPIPPESEQPEIVRRVEALFKTAEGAGDPFRVDALCTRKKSRGSHSHPASGVCRKKADFSV